MNDNPNDEYDSPWKEAVEHHFPDFMAFYFPKAYDQIDWGKEQHTHVAREAAAVLRGMKHLHATQYAEYRYCVALASIPLR